MTDLEKLVRTWNEAAKNMEKQLCPLSEELAQSLLRVQRQAEEALRPYFEVQNKLNEFAQSVVIPKLDLSSAFPKFDLPDLSQLKLIGDAARSLYAAIEPTFAKIQESLKELPPRMREALLLLGQHGWYLDLEFALPGIWALEKALSEGDLASAEKGLINHFERRLDEIEEALTGKFPHRAQIIRSAFRAHRRGEYELSIPVLLAQTDGICKELTSKYLFIRENKRPAVAAYTQQFLADTFQASLLSPLTEILPIGASHHERRADGDQLNRHAVLHGESVTYGTQANSLKAVSLINYISHVL